MEFCSLGSGSAGNALLVRSANACLMLDCGFGPRELERRLSTRGMHPRDINAIVVTHEHSDHVGGVAAVARRFGIPVFATAGTAKAARLDPTAWLPVGVAWAHGEGAEAGFVRLTLDGVDVADVGTTQWTLTGVTAGDHTLTGAVLFADGHDPEVSATVAFTAQ